MKPFAFLLLSCLIMIIISCKNDDDLTTDEPCEPVITKNYSYDTIFPSDYLMTYPGSWWEYSDGSIDSCKLWDSVPIHNTTSSGSCLFVDEDMWILPEGTNNIRGHICYDKNLITPNDYTSSYFIPFYDTLIGKFHEATYLGGEGVYTYSSYCKKETLERSDSMLVGSNTYFDVLHIKVTSSTTYYHTGSGPTYVSEYYFAKNIGLIRYIRINNGSVTKVIELVNYYISPH